MPRWRLLGVALAVVVGCHKRVDPPDPAQYRSMSLEQRCEVTAPRATQCIEEVMEAELRTLLKHPDDAPTIIDDHGRATGSEAAAIHRVQCAGSPRGEYQDAVIACWDRDGCREFAACVAAARATQH